MRAKLCLLLTTLRQDGIVCNLALFMQDCKVWGKRGLIIADPQILIPWADFDDLDGFGLLMARALKWAPARSPSTKNSNCENYVILRWKIRQWLLHRTDATASNFEDMVLSSAPTDSAPTFTSGRNLLRANHPFRLVARIMRYFRLNTIEVGQEDLEMIPWT